LGGYIAAILSTQVFNSSSSLFPIPLLLLEMLIAGVVCGVLGILSGIPVAVAWDLFGDRYNRLC